MAAAHFPATRPKVVLLSVAIILCAFILCVAAAALFAWFSEHPIYPAYDPDHPTAAQIQSLNEAKQWDGRELIHSGIPEGVRAVNTKTGARFVFDSSLPSGWVEDRQ